MCASSEMKMGPLDYLKELNRSQYEAVVHTDGPALIIAGAGSGKTRVLTYRIAHLLQRGVHPASILALTFTNKAAREMKARIAGIVGEDTVRLLWMGTFHSIFSRILRIEHKAAGYPSNYTIFDASDSRNLIKTVIKGLGLDDKVYRPGVVASRISMAKNNLISPAVYTHNAELRLADKNRRMPAIAEIYKEYAKRCFLSGAMDFDDLLLKTNLLFRDHPEILEKYQQRFGYALVDEYQDTNYAQYLIVKNLAARHQNLCVVGDDAQSIYSFRGARIENILSFQKDYPNHKIFKLEQNYRSTQTIVKAANSIISKNKRQIPKKVFSSRESGANIRVLSALTDNEEGFLVAREIEQFRLRDHYKNMDFAILYRTNAQSRIFEEALRKRNIPYKIYGGLSFYQRKEIKDLLAYFRIIVNPWDNEAMKRIINYPARGIGQTTVAKLETAAVTEEISIWKVIAGLPEKNSMNLNKGIVVRIMKFAAQLNVFSKVVAEQDAYMAAHAIAEHTGILKAMHQDRTPEGISRHENIQELLNGIQEFSSNAREEGRPGMLGNYLEEVALLTDQDTEKGEDRDKVTLMTVHSAKGLEFKNVFVVGLEDNLFPPAKARERKTTEALEEERRLFYVALTRARENAWFSHARQRHKWGKLEYCSPSPFLLEMDESFLEGTNGAKQTGGGFTGPLRPSRAENFQQSRKRPLSPRNTVPRNFAQRKPGGAEKAGSTMDPFTGDPPEKIVQGMVVLHQRFGEGKVLKVEGPPPDKKATVFFRNAGQKQLLLKFAKLKIKQ